MVLQDVDLADNLAGEGRKRVEAELGIDALERAIGRSKLFELPA
jgi:hypothetical protein